MIDTAGMPTTDEVSTALDESGYVLIPEVLSDTEIDQVRAALEPHLASGPVGRNDFEGYATQRVYSLIAKSRAFDRLVLDPLVLDIAERLLGPAVLLTASLAISVGPGETEQNLHYDDGFYPMARPRPPISLSAMWTIDEFTADNGATVVCPGSHRWGDGPFHRPDDLVVATAPPGSLLLYLGTLVHAGGTNRTDRSRLGVSIQYVAGWARQQENFMMALGTDGARALPERLQELVGYNIHSLFMGMVDGRHPQKLLTR